MNSIDIKQNLAGIPTNMRRMIGLSACHLVNAGIFANDAKEAAAEANRIYKGCNKRGMYKKVMSDSKKLIIAAGKAGLTLEKPYKIVDGMILGCLSDSVVFLCNIGPRK